MIVSLRWRAILVQNMRQRNKTFASQQFGWSECQHRGRTHMVEKVGRTGGCLCGKVTFTITEPVSEIGACHCDMCRRWSGGPLLAIDCDHAVEFEGEEHIVTYRSSKWAERGFCGTCGSNLFYRLVDSGQTMLCAGTLDDQSSLKFTEQIFIDEKPAFYDFANETKMMTGAEVFALYAPPDASK
jgi:hypothetical protein